MNKLDSQQGNTYEFDVLVIGAGLAGLSYCLQLVKLRPKIKIALVTKAELYECNTRYAQGGIAAATGPNDSLEAHIKDTLKAGDGLCYRPAVKNIINAGPDAIQDIMQYAVNFNQDAKGRFSLAKEGGHSQRRIFNSGDQTGLNLMLALTNAAKSFPQINYFENHVAVNLMTYYHPHKTRNQGEVLGAYILDTNSNCIHGFAVRNVVLACGGAGKTYRFTSNSMVATGDGVAMAYRAGARVGNMEFYQFHPTSLHHPQLNNFLISEAVRGEGALLLNENGQRFMVKYDPKRLELSTRDIVSRAIFSEIEQGEKGFVYLDIRHQKKSFLKTHFPNIFNTLKTIGIDMSQDLIPVVPAAHYQCGGILTNLNGETDLKRLYAIGEVAFTGLHGANRLASNSLLEALVMGKNAAYASLKEIDKPNHLINKILPWNSPATVDNRRASQINAHWLGLRGEMTSYAGIVRTEAGLQDLLQLILKRKEIIEEYYWNHSTTRDFIELRNIVLNAELIVRAALARKESRGGHYREDYPQKNLQAKESIDRLTTPQQQFSYP